MVRDIILDPFVGSGTTILACEQLGRKCLAMDIDPEAVAVTLERWYSATKKKPCVIC
jgi:DNA modification methylase